MGKRKLACFIGLMSVCLLFGCGEKKKTVKDNLVKGDPNEIQGMDKYNNIGNSDDSNNDIVNPDMYGEPGDDVAISDNTVSTDSISDNGTDDFIVDNNSDSTVPANVISSNAVDTPEIGGPNPALESVSSNGFDVSKYESNNNKLDIINLSGRNIKQLYITFSEGGINNREILGDKRLNDAGSFSYQIEDMTALKNASRLTLTVKGVDKKDKDIIFGEVDVFDPSNMTLVLTKEKGKYTMYFK